MKIAENSASIVAPSPSLRGSKDTDNDQGVSGANTPDIDKETGDVGRRAITSADQAFRICEAMFNPTSQRNMMNGTIAKKYGDDPPFDNKALRDAGEDWRHNFPTGFLSSFVNRIVPAPMSLIDQAKFLTSAKLDIDDDPDGKLSEIFQRETTSLFRSWNGFRPMCYGLAQEDVLFGYASAACLDPDEWRPEHLRQNEFAVPDGSGQQPTLIPMFGVKKDFLIHELYALIKNKEAAIAAGWDWDNAVQAINEAMPATALRSPNDTRDQADLNREAASAGTSHDADAKVIEVYRLFSVEVDGKVSQHVVRRAGEPRSLYQRDDEYESIEEMLSLFTLEEGNSKFYGSKGVGRKIINEHIAVERGRNRLCDQAYLKTMIWVVGENGLPTVQFKVRHPIGMIGTDAEINTEILPEDLQPLLLLDERLTAYAEAAVGSYLVEKRGEEGDPHETATAASIRARKEQQQSAAFLQRFFGQFAELISMMTRRACNPRTSDEKAKEYQERMIEQGLTPELIEKLADRPAVEVVHDLAQAQNDAIIELCSVLLKSPFANQKAVWRKLAEVKGNARLADELLLKDEFDPNEMGAQARLQILEIAAIRTGESVNVIGIDLHPIHLKVLVGDIGNAMPKILKNPPEAIPQLLDNLNAGIRHGEAHCMAWESQAKTVEDPDALTQIAKYRQFFDEADQLLVAIAEKAKGSSPNGMQPSMMGQPGPQLPPGSAPQTGTPPPGEQPPDSIGDRLGKISTSISYKDAPPSIQRQIEWHAGFTPAYGASPENHFIPQHGEQPGSGFPIYAGQSANPAGVLFGPNGEQLQPSQPAAAGGPDVNLAGEQSSSAGAPEPPENSSLTQGAAPVT